MIDNSYENTKNEFDFEKLPIILSFKKWALATRVLKMPDFRSTTKYGPNHVSDMSGFGHTESWS
jgi:hypothetical protein